MKVHRRLSRRALIAACSLALPLAAADPGPSFHLKLRSGVTAGTLREDLADNRILGFDLAGRFPLGEAGALAVELGFDYAPGRDHDAMPTSGKVYYDPRNPVSTYEGQPLYLSPSNSIDFRKESLQGFSLRGMYLHRIPGAGSWYGFAGASLDFHKATAQFSGTLIPVYGAAPGTPVPNFEPVDPADPEGPLKDAYEGWAFTREKSKVGVGILAGVGVPLKDYCSLEFRLRNLPYTHFDHRPFTLTGAPAATVETTHRGFVFEVALSLTI